MCAEDSSQCLIPCDAPLDNSSCMEEEEQEVVERRRSSGLSSSSPSYASPAQSLTPSRAASPASLLRDNGDEPAMAPAVFEDALPHHPAMPELDTQHCYPPPVPSSPHSSNDPPDSVRRVHDGDRRMMVSPSDVRPLCCGQCDAALCGARADANTSVLPPAVSYRPDNYANTCGRGPPSTIGDCAHSQSAAIQDADAASIKCNGCPENAVSRAVSVGSTASSADTRT